MKHQFYWYALTGVCLTLLNVQKKDSIESPKTEEPGGISTEKRKAS